MSRSFPSPEAGAIAQSERTQHTDAEKAERAAARAETERLLAKALSWPNAKLMTEVLFDGAFHAYRSVHGEIPARTRYAALHGQAERLTIAATRTAAEAIFKSGEGAA